MRPDPERPGLMIPDDYPQSFVQAAYDYFRGGYNGSHIVKELRGRFGTEKFYMEALEEVWTQNSWPIDIKTRKEWRKLFRGTPGSGTGGTW